MRYLSTILMLHMTSSSCFATEKSYNFLAGMIETVLTHSGEKIKQPLQSQPHKTKPSTKQWNKLITSLPTWELPIPANKKSLTAEIVNLLAKKPNKKLKKESIDRLYLKTESLTGQRWQSHAIGLAHAYMNERYYADCLKILYRIYREKPKTRVIYESVQKIYSNLHKGAGSVALQSP